ncbi:MAG: acyl-ACP--UDP-N-acetylglucosamine O-acyltransferase [Inquilinaceae bacterium]
MGTEIHPSSVVDPAAAIGDGVTIGPFCVVGPEVTLEDGVSLISHVAVAGRTRIGSGTRVYPFASLGHPPQDLKFKGEVSELTVGRDVTIREGVTANPGTEGGGMKTVVGDKCLLMAYSHVAHDCRVGNSVILANSATLGGHVTVGDHAILGGLSAVQQWVRIGEHAFIGGMTGVEQDVIPFGMVVGERGHLAGLNLVGLKRRGFDRSDIHTLRAAYRLLFQEPGELSQRIDVLAEAYGEHPAVTHLLAFLRAESGRKILQPKFEDAA